MKMEMKMKKNNNEKINLYFNRRNFNKLMSVLDTNCKDENLDDDNKKISKTLYDKIIKYSFYMPEKENLKEKLSVKLYPSEIAKIMNILLYHDIINPYSKDFFEEAKENYDNYKKIEKKKM